MLNFVKLGAAEYDVETKMVLADYLMRYKSHTFESYFISIGIYCAWLNANEVKLLDVKRPHLEGFINYLREERKNVAATINHHLTPITGLYKFAHFDGIIERNPCANIMKPKEFRDPMTQNFLTSRELRSVLAAGSYSEYPSDAGLMGLLAGCGLRISEALGVNIEDYAGVRSGYHILKLVGKGGRPAELPIAIPIMRLLEKAENGRRTGKLLVRDGYARHMAGLPITYKSATSSIQRICKVAGIERSVNPHAFRHGYITAGLDAGIPLREMQRAARHADPRTTVGYDHGALNLDRHANHIIAATLAGSI